MSSPYIVWKCLNCNIDLHTSSSDAGKSLRCPECKTLQVVPLTSGNSPSNVSIGEQMVDGMAKGLQQYQGRGCFIATELYGIESFEVMILRRFRDQVLLNSAFGYVLVCLYYRLSPWMVHVIRISPWIRSKVQFIVAYAVRIAYRSLGSR
jgi:hypothetical protein